MGSSYSRRSYNRQEREANRNRSNHAPANQFPNQPAQPPNNNAAPANAPYPLPHQYYVLQNGLYSGQPFLVGGHRLIPANQLPSFFLEGIRPDLAFLPFQQQPRVSQPPPPQMQHTCTIRNDVNLKKNTLKLVNDDPSRELYRLEFSFDASTDCTITVFYVATETTEPNAPATFRSIHDAPPLLSRFFSKGLGQVYTQPVEEVLEIPKYKEDELIYSPSSSHYPIIIRLETVAVAGSQEPAADGTSKGGVQSQSTFATLVRLPEGGYGIKVIKQKILVGGVSYELQEIYGIEQNSEEEADNGRECVICMSEPRDTTLLPCRHMCMCNECAKVLRYQTNKCPICRSPVDSLLQIKVKKDGGVANPAAAGPATAGVATTGTSTPPASSSSAGAPPPATAK